MKIFDQSISPEELAGYRKDMLARQLAYAAEHSPFYAELLSGVIPGRAELTDLPFTSAGDVTARGAEMVCVPGSEVQRIVTQRTSGSSGSPKRIYFSAADLQATVDFFAVGMGYMCSAGDRVLVLMSGNTPDGLGSLVERGLCKLGAEPLIYGNVTDYGDAVRVCREFLPHTVIGAPATVRRLALCAPELRPANVLLSSDYVSDAAVGTIRRLWECGVFTHYGLTETCYGCAVECPSHTGMHIRNDEFIIEIIDPELLIPLPAWQPGEIVITTLRREAFPLVRYRTGDMGVMIGGSCGCGSSLPRLGRVFGRIDELKRDLNVYKLDETLLRFDAILDYSASLHGSELSVLIETEDRGVSGKAKAGLEKLFSDVQISVSETQTGAGAGKRKIDRLV
ncbi:MAG: phenylacetate--CoA ligase family protein [Oscillospiraceae bacterium]|nr:phenylacetate--CoA ligase family protein [Oscillospiraceae bacterium]